VNGSIAAESLVVSSVTRQSRWDAGAYQPLSSQSEPSPPELLHGP